MRRLLVVFDLEAYVWLRSILFLLFQLSPQMKLFYIKFSYDFSGQALEVRMWKSTPLILYFLCEWFKGNIFQLGIWLIWNSSYCDKFQFQMSMKKKIRKCTSYNYLKNCNFKNKKIIVSLIEIHNIFYHFMS